MTVSDRESQCEKERKKGVMRRNVWKITQWNKSQEYTVFEKEFDLQNRYANRKVLFLVTVTKFIIDYLKCNSSVRVILHISTLRCASSKSNLVIPIGALFDYFILTYTIIAFRNLSLSDGVSSGGNSQQPLSLLRNGYRSLCFCTDILYVPGSMSLNIECSTPSTLTLSSKWEKIWIHKLINFSLAQLSAEPPTSIWMV